MGVAVQPEPEPGKPARPEDLSMPDAAATDPRFSDVETASSTGGANSSVSSSGSSSLPRCSVLSSRLSFDCSPSAALSATFTFSPPPPTERARPHRSGDAAWTAIRAASRPLGPKDFKLIRRIGGGDIGTVYLCRLLHATTAPNQLFAMKVVDRRLVAKKNKLHRAATETRILRRLDHPFVPTLYAAFDAGPHFACAVTEFCPGGDLHALRHRAPSRRFPVLAARFYAAEVLLALEYLHCLGIVYRDLKPENVLVRADGHVMLTDFDLALESAAEVVVIGEDEELPEPDTSVSCFPFKRRRHGHQSKKKSQATAGRFVAEPVSARSSSFVGTHEYVAPEVACGNPHGAAVDWWAFGVFLYELLHGRTPFAGADTESTLRNIARRPLAFPPSSGPCGPLDAAARDLIAALLVKDPAKRLGARRGAAEVKAHPFFKGVNFALLRSTRPPVVPAGGAPVDGVRRSQSCKAAVSTVRAGGAKKTCKDAVAVTAGARKTCTDAGFDLFF